MDYIELINMCWGRMESYLIARGTHTFIMTEEDYCALKYKRYSKLKNYIIARSRRTLCQK